MWTKLKQCTYQHVRHTEKCDFYIQYISEDFACRSHSGAPSGLTGTRGAEAVDRERAASGRALRSETSASAVSESTELPRTVNTQRLLCSIQELLTSTTGSSLSREERHQLQQLCQTRHTMSFEILISFWIYCQEE